MGVLLVFLVFWRRGRYIVLDQQGDIKKGNYNKGLMMKIGFGVEFTHGEMFSIFDFLIYQSLNRTPRQVLRNNIVWYSRILAYRGLYHHVTRDVYVSSKKTNRVTIS